MEKQFCFVNPEYIMQFVILYLFFQVEKICIYERKVLGSKPMLYMFRPYELSCCQLDLSCQIAFIDVFTLRLESSLRYEGIGTKVNVGLIL